MCMDGPQCGDDCPVEGPTPQPMRPTKKINYKNYFTFDKKKKQGVVV